MICGRVLILAGLLITIGNATDTRGQGGIILGTAATDHGQVDYGWRIRPLGGEPLELEAFRGRVLFINAWASWCSPCVREMSSIERLAERVADIDVSILMVSVEREGAVQRHLRRYPSALPIFLEEQRFPPIFRLRGIPMSWVVDRDGRIVLRHFGATNWNDPAVEAFLREMASPDN